MCAEVRTASRIVKLPQLVVKVTSYFFFGSSFVFGGFCPPSGLAAGRFTVTQPVASRAAGAAATEGTASAAASVTSASPRNTRRIVA